MDFLKLLILAALFVIAPKITGDNDDDETEPDEEDVALVLEVPDGTLQTYQTLVTPHIDDF